MKSKQEKINIFIDSLSNGGWICAYTDEEMSIAISNIKICLNDETLLNKQSFKTVLNDLFDTGWISMEDQEEKDIILQILYSVFNETPLIVEKLPENIIEQLNKALEKACVKATPEYLSNLLSGSRLKKQISEINGVDTAEREIFLSMLGHKLTGLEWPCNADTEEYVNTFLKKLFEAVKNEEGLSFVE